MAMDRTRGYMPLRDAIDRLFAESFITPSGVFGSGSGFPPSDLYVTDNDVILEMAVPGANPHDINVQVTGDTVTVTGEVRRQHSTGGSDTGGQAGGQKGSQTTGKPRQQPYFQEIWQGQFQRSFTLPIEVDAAKADASFDNGILTITMPKSEATKPRKIQVKPQQQSITQEGSSGVQKETVPVQGSGQNSGQGS